MPHLIRVVALLILGTTAALATPAPASTAPASTAPVRYQIHLAEPHTHYAEIIAKIPVASDGPLTVMMPVWIPGSYLVREYAMHVERVEATNATGATLTVEKTRKNRWTITGAIGHTVTLRYQLYGRAPTVRANWIDADFALFNGASTFLAPVDALQRPYEIRVFPPKGWPHVITALSPHPDGAPHHFIAPDFDHLADNPILAGRLDVQRFELDETPHAIATVGLSPPWDAARAAKDFQRIVNAHHALWGQLPYPRYVLFNLLTTGGGGLEHRDAAVIISEPWAMARPADYAEWLRVVSHELFHAWNVKRLRPQGLGPFDYENENYTRSLWLAEGATAYYDALLLRRAKLTGDRAFLGHLSAKIRATQTSPGRHVRSLEQASFDAWIKHYRPDENSLNSTVSYYGKGAVVAFLLDAHLRVLTDGRTSLDTLMRTAYTQFADGPGYTPADIERLASAQAGADLSPWFARYVRGTDELDYTEALAWYGLRFKKPRPGQRPPWIGAEVRSRGGRQVIRRVERDSPAAQAGFDVSDELIAINGARLPLGDGYKKGLARHRAGQEVEFLLSRRGHLRNITLTLAAQPSHTWRLELNPDATDAQKAHLKALTDLAP